MPSLDELTDVEIETKGKKIAEELGIEFIGVDDFKTYLFNDKTEGMEITINVAILDKEVVKQELEKSRQAYAEKS